MVTIIVGYNAANGKGNVASGADPPTASTARGSPNQRNICGASGTGLGSSRRDGIHVPGVWAVARTRTRVRSRFVTGLAARIEPRETVTALTISRGRESPDQRMIFLHAGGR
jgi:hypothetical protein